MFSADYLMRTALNVQHSDVTLIITRSPRGGTRETINFCIEHNKPKFTVDPRHKLKPPEFAAWVHQHNIRILNVAGPRESKYPDMGKQTECACGIICRAGTEWETRRVLVP